MGLLDNKVAFVTGAGSGIGKAIAIQYAVEGAKVVVSDINEAQGNAVVNEIDALGGDAIFVKANASVAEDIEHLVGKTVDTYGRLDIACNNAGVTGTMAKTADLRIEDWHKALDINLHGVFYGVKYAINQMLKNDGGVIVNMGSIHSITAVPNSIAYAASKHAVLGITRNVAVEYGTSNIRCHAVGPGYIDTPLLANLSAEAKQGLIAKHPIGRLGTAEEVANLVVYLSSEKSSFMTGGYYAIDGGYTAI
ncbi:SDR family NAD(P)-dependent oxidoreductase [Sphingobacterium sp. Mn56C]|uniref:SDR family NAD(P)-dependent oxidoreductase n=1 Tax=Sphingobacterium sp. Mn56C TaxID=3395261 RepID=UPI003BDC25E3